MRILMVLILVAAISFAGIVNPSVNGVVSFTYDNGPAGQGSVWYLIDTQGRIMDSGAMPDGIRDAWIIIETLPNGVYACIIVADGEIVEQGIFTKL